MKKPKKSFSINVGPLHIPRLERITPNLDSINVGALLSALNSGENDKMISIEPLRKIFAEEKHIELCLVLFGELGAMNDDLVCLLTTRKGYILFAIIDATKKFNKAQFSDAYLLSIFNECLGTSYKQIKRSKASRKPKPDGYILIKKEVDYIIKKGLEMGLL